MGFRTWMATWLLSNARLIGRYLGTELVVETSDHSIKTTMETPDKSSRAWDDNMYRYGQLYIKGYANPVKPSVEYHEDLRDPDTATLEEMRTDGGEGDYPELHTELISSPRYREYMRQDLISQLLNPREQWRLIAYAVIGLALLMVANVVISLSAAGVF